MSASSSAVKCCCTELRRFDAVRHVLRTLQRRAPHEHRTLECRCLWTINFASGTSQTSSTRRNVESLPRRLSLLQTLRGGREKNCRLPAMMVISRPRPPAAMKNLLSHLLIQEVQIYRDLSERSFDCQRVNMRSSRLVWGRGEQINWSLLTPSNPWRLVLGKL